MRLRVRSNKSGGIVSWGRSQLEGEGVGQGRAEGGQGPVGGEVVGVSLGAGLSGGQDDTDENLRWSDEFVLLSLTVVSSPVWSWCSCWSWSSNDPSPESAGFIPSRQSVLATEALTFQVLRSSQLISINFLVIALNPVCRYWRLQSIVLRVLSDWLISQPGGKWRERPVL